jgi:hypothetical protein
MMALPARISEAFSLEREGKFLHSFNLFQSIVQQLIEGDKNSNNHNNLSSLPYAHQCIIYQFQNVWSLFYLNHENELIKHYLAKALNHYHSVIHQLEEGTADCDNPNHCSLDLRYLSTANNKQIAPAILNAHNNIPSDVRVSTESSSRWLRRNMEELTAANNKTQSPTQIINRYVHGLIMFNILIRYIQQPNRAENAVLTQFIALFRRWPQSLRSSMRTSFFVLYSYVLIICRLREPAFVPTATMRNRAQKWLLQHNSRNLQKPLVLNEQHYSSLYLLGESHTLSLCWQWFHVKNHVFQLIPKLIPGLKAFHFTKDLQSHEAAILHNQIETIPDHSIVLLICGEIDCRLGEGLSEAVKKGKYPNMQQAIQSTINHYLEGLQCIAARKQLTVFIVPVRPPYLRRLKIKKCRKFQVKLKQKFHNHNVQQAASADPAECKGEAEDDSIPLVDLKRIQLVYRHAILIRDFNRCLKGSIAAFPSQQLHYVNNFYANLCENNTIDTHSTNESQYEQFDEGNAENYLLQEQYSLEGLHMNAIPILLLEEEFNRVAQVQPNIAQLFQDQFARVHRDLLLPTKHQTEEKHTSYSEGTDFSVDWLHSTE